MATCLIGLGSNLGDRSRNLDEAIRLLAADAGQLLAQCTPVLTSPVGGPPGQSDFLNGAVLLDTHRSPLELLTELQRIEQQLGRVRVDRWGQRSLDLDLLLYDQCVMNTEMLAVPHPRMAFRRFVLAPAAEIAAEMIHPTTGFSIGELLARINDPPLHISVLGRDAAMIAEQAASQANAVLLKRPPLNSIGSIPPAESSEFLRSSVRDWETALAMQADAVVSDYWVAEAWLGQDDRGEPQTSSEIQAAEHAISVRLALPHLVMWLEPMTDKLPDSLRRLRDQVFRPRQFPVLTCRDAGTDSAVAEIKAALEAMRRS